MMSGVTRRNGGSRHASKPSKNHTWLERRHFFAGSVQGKVQIIADPWTKHTTSLYHDERIKA